MSNYPSSIETRGYIEASVGTGLFGALAVFQVLLHRYDRDAAAAALYKSTGLVIGGWGQCLRDFWSCHHRTVWYALDLPSFLKSMGGIFERSMQL